MFSNKLIIFCDETLTAEEGTSDEDVYNDIESGVGAGTGVGVGVGVGVGTGVGGV